MVSVLASVARLSNVDEKVAPSVITLYRIRKSEQRIRRSLSNALMSHS